ncbi:PIR protein [Plasmodium sp. gorilla clade G1]|nr:PIR protein [Plasmodium sp. gorilla clade G1]
MKMHCINILLFSVPLNILVNTHKKTSITQKRTTTRLLCECELYSPAIYDNDAQMKSVIDNFNKQTQQRLHEYDQRMKTTRQECKEQCDKDIQKIILKDKLEKELMDKFATLHTDMQSDAIPTCVCEKSIADKVEKGCLKCAQNLGGIAVPSSGVLGEIAAFAVNGWKTTAIAAATKYAMKEGAAQGAVAGNAHGIKIVNLFLKGLGVEELIPGISNSIGTKIPYTNAGKISDVIIGKYEATCGFNITSDTHAMCTDVGTKFNILTNSSRTNLPTRSGIKRKVIEFVDKATRSANAQAAEVSSKTAAEITAQETNVINATYASWQTTIIASIVAIVVIVLIMVIIYLILRYRRKKKMKKKLQYIKLLEE